MLRKTSLLIVSTGLFAALAGTHGGGCSAEDQAPKGLCNAAMDDGNPCTRDSCKEHQETHTVVPGAMCGTGNRLRCNSTGECFGCTIPSDCGQDTECLEWKCSPEGICSRTVRAAPPPGTIPAAASECLILKCKGMPPVPTPEPRAEGAACGMGNQQVCDGEGKCVNCTPTAGCSTNDYCYDNQCYWCVDYQKNANETDVDCGGASCERCGQNERCKVDSDCQSTHCVDGKCCTDACTTPCMSCNTQSSPGQCRKLPQHEDDPTASPACAGAQTCDGNGQCKADIGQPCNGDLDCASGKCKCGNGWPYTDCANGGFCTKTFNDTCDKPNECLLGYCENEQCARLPNGAPCTHDDECKSLMGCNDTTFTCY